MGSVCAHKDRTETAWLEQAPGEGVQGIGTMLYLSHLGVKFQNPWNFYPRHALFAIGPGRCVAWHVVYVPLPTLRAKIRFQAAWAYYRP